MKKLLYKVTASLCIAMAATSCLNDVLEVESQSAFDGSAVFSEYSLAEYNVFAIADACGATNGYRGRLDLWYGFNTDIELYSSGWNGNKSWNTNQYLQLCEYNAPTNNQVMNTTDNGYIQFFTGIERANICIEGLREYANLDDPDMAYLLGESLTWRAFFYYELIKMWGEAPLRDAPVSAETTYLPKVDRDIIYNLVLNDLREAYKLVYEPFKSTQTQSASRVNKALVAGLFARTVLSATGYAWRPDDGQVGTGNYGSLRTSTDPQFSGEGRTTLLKESLTMLEEAMKMGNSLESSYETLWRKFNNSEHLSSPEVLWVRPFSNGRGRWNYTHAGQHYGSSFIGGGDRGGSTGPAPTLWWKFEKADTRRDLTCVPFCYDMRSTSEYQGWQLRGRVNYWYWGKYRFEWMFANPYTGGNDDGVKPIVMRYSDILLMASELAANTGDLAKAKEYLGKVRERAYGAYYDDPEYKGASYVNALTLGNAESVDGARKDYQAEGTIMKAIIDERALEFAGEMLRKQDLIRWGLLKYKMDEAAKDVQALAEMTGEYAAYNDAGENKTVTGMNPTTVREYSIYWRENSDSYPASGVMPIEIFGLEKDEIGQKPQGDGWTKVGYISRQAFWNSTTADAYRYTSFYKNNETSADQDTDNGVDATNGNPWPRSVWPHFANPIMLSQGTLVNDYGY